MPVVQALRSVTDLKVALISTGQHREMLDQEPVPGADAKAILDRSRDLSGHAFLPVPDLSIV